MLFWYTEVLECGGNCSTPLFHIFLEPHTFCSLFTMCYNVISPDYVNRSTDELFMNHELSIKLTTCHLTSLCLEYCARSKECIAHMVPVDTSKVSNCAENVCGSYLHISSVYNFESWVVIRNHAMHSFLEAVTLFYYLMGARRWCFLSSNFDTKTGPCLKISGRDLVSFDNSTYFNQTISYIGLWCN